MSRTDDERLNARYENLVADYYQAQAQFRNTMLDCQRLQTVIRAKQEVIEVLLPYYPYPLTQELQAKIALT